MNTENISIECEEDGFWLIVDGDTPDISPLEHGGRFRWRITDPDALYDSVRSTIGEWIAEREEARRTLPVASYDPSEAYDPWSTKHPGFHGALSGVWDYREGK